MKYTQCKKTSKLNILYVGADDMPGGVSGYVNCLINLCNADKYVFHMTVTGQSLSGSQMNTNVIRHIMPAAYNILSLCMLVKQLRNILIKEKIHILHLHTARAGLLGVLSAIMLPVTVIFTVHSWRHEQKESLFLRIVFYMYEFFICSLSNYVTFCTNYDMDIGIGKKLVRESNCKVIKTRIDPQPFENINIHDITNLRLAFNIPYNAAIVGSVAYMTERKDPLTFVKVAARVLTVRPDMFFVWVGDGELREATNQLALQLNIKGRLIITGFVSADQVPRYLSMFDIFLFTSHYEGVPLSVMSAQASGLPVVCSKYTGSGVEELIEDGVTGMLFEPGDDVKAAEHIIGILEKRYDVMSMKAEMKKQFEEKHAIPIKMAMEYEQLYDLASVRE